MVKYSPNRYYQYPALRPDNDDYPVGNITTFVEKQSPNCLRLAFKIEDSTLQSLLDSGIARCGVMLYCSSTLYSDMVLGNPKDQVLEIPIPYDSIAGELELWPSVITLADVDLSTTTAHDEYEGQSIRVPALRPLALDERWRLPLADTRSTPESLFILQQDPEIEHGLFVVDADPGKPYIEISMSPDTSEQFRLLRRDESWTLATVYTASLTQVLSRLDPQDESLSDNQGWYNAIRAKLDELGIPTNQQIDEPWRIAQQIWGGPYSAILSETEASATEGAEGR